MNKKILVLYQDWDGWFLDREQYKKFEHWFKYKDKAYDKNNYYYILSLGRENRVLKLEENIEVEIIKSSPVKQIIDLFKFKRRVTEIIEDFEPDYVYVPFLYLASSLPNKVNRRYKVIGFLRDITPEMIKAKGGIRRIGAYVFYLLDYLAMKRIDILFYNSPHLKDYALRMGFSKKLIFAPRDIVDKEYFSSSVVDNLKEKLLNKYNLKDKKIILTIGRLTPEKNIEMGIKTMKHLPENFVYLVVGEGFYRNHLERLVRRYGVEDRVFFLGYIPHQRIWSVYKLADIFWLLSKTNFEGIPNVILEAWYSKVPVVVSNIPAFKCLVRNNETGVVLRNFDERELAEKTMEILKDEELYRRLVTGGYEEMKRITSKHIGVKELFK
ncbi:MAG TPA: glycosyltransferase [Methanothermococcus okinawensis]|nr:glycosyltransferase [Methanothermococcus okinawensis]